MHADRDYSVVVSNTAPDWRGFGPNGHEVRRYLAHIRTLAATRLSSVAADERQLGLDLRRAGDSAAPTPPERIWLDAIAEIHRRLGSEASALLRCGDRASQRARTVLQERPGSWLISLGAALLVFAPFLDQELVAVFFRTWLPTLGFAPEGAPEYFGAGDAGSKPPPAAVPIRNGIASSASIRYGLPPT